MAGFGWSLSRPNFFAKFKNISVSGATTKQNLRTGNILVISGDVCYIWWNLKKTLVRVLCSDIWMNKNEINFQEWALSDQLSFEITHLIGRNHPRETVIAWGPLGVAAIKYNPKMGLKTPPLSCTIIGEKIYVDHVKLRILQVKWHPTKKQDILGVLNNDYYIRLYKLSQPMCSISLVCVGPQESIPFTYTQHAVGLTEPPVDFEFGQRLAKSGLWVVFILKSSGTVSYLLLKTLETNNRCQWDAERIIYTDGDLEDVFEEAASVLVSSTYPPVMIIGCLNGNLYHTVLLPSESDTNEPSELDMDEKFLSGDVTLFVKEILELEPDNEGGFSSMQLIQDPLCTHRYSCIHDEGVHVVNMHFVVNMKQFMVRPPYNSSNDSELISCHQSTVRYVLYTKGNGSDQGATASGINVGFSESVPQKFFVLLDNGETLVYELPHALDNFRIMQGKDNELLLPPNERMCVPNAASEFPEDGLNMLDAVKKLLIKNTNQPYLDLEVNGHGLNEETQNEKNEAILMSSFRTLKWDYINRQEQVLAFLKESLKTVEGKEAELKGQLEGFSNCKADLRNAAENIAELYEEETEQEEAIHKRLESVLFQYHQLFPMITDDEKTWLRTMESLETEVANMIVLVDGLKLNTSALSLKPERKGGKRNELSTSQISKIYEQVLEQHEALANLTNSMKQLKKELIFT